jgi:protein-S-isoprenylcysteine O-methyltransferase Ste14
MKFPQIGTKGQASPTVNIIKMVERILMQAVLLGLLLALLLLAGLDLRNGWSQFAPEALQAASQVVFGMSQVWIGWAMLTNRYFAAAVRIQTERGHTVATGGPYRWMRHPGYVGMILQMLATPLALGTWWGLIPGILSAALYVIWTALENQTLQQELAGYTDYARQVLPVIARGLVAN